jgi:hypothetical protein
MSIRALNVTATRRYVLKIDPDRGTPNETVFRLKMLDSRDTGYLRDSMIAAVPDESSPNGETYTVRNGHLASETVAFGLSGFERFLDDAGDEVEFRTHARRLGNVSYDVVHSDILRVLPPAAIEELAIAIRTGSKLDETTAKN